MNPVDFYMQVYGLDNVVMPVVPVEKHQEVAPAQLSEVARQRPSPWVVFMSDLKINEFPAFQEMFAKITAALGLQSDEFSILLQDSDQQIPEGARVCVAFGGMQMGWVEASNSPYKLLVVSSFQEMAQNPELKKSAWSFLKQIMDHRRID